MVHGIVAFPFILPVAYPIWLPELSKILADGMTATSGRPRALKFPLTLTEPLDGTHETPDTAAYLAPDTLTDSPLLLEHPDRVMPAVRAAAVAPNQIHRRGGFAINSPHLACEIGGKWMPAIVARHRPVPVLAII